MYHTINTIVFDLGGVLIDWNPEYLFSKIFKDREEMEYFLTEVCNMDWNEEQDAGRSLVEATETLIQQHPQYQKEISAYYKRWDEMLGGPIEHTVDILEQLYEDGLYPLYALTNWSKETFPIAMERFEFLNYFQGIVVSGEEKIRKPDIRFYQLLQSRYNINPFKTLFIDDNLRNIEAARAIGFHTVHFTDPFDLEEILVDLEIMERM